MKQYVHETGAAPLVAAESKWSTETPVRPIAITGAQRVTLHKIAGAAGLSRSASSNTSALNASLELLSR